MLDKGRIYITSVSGYVFALDAVTGRQLWHANVGDTFNASPAVSQGTVFVGNCERTVFALDAETGKTKWRFTASRYVSVSPVVGNGLVYIIVDGNYLVALGAYDGRIRWRQRTGGWAEELALSASGKLYVAGLNAQRGASVVSYNAASGKRLWRTDAAFTYPQNRALPCLDAAGNVFVGLGNSFSALDGDTGKVLWKVSVPKGYITTAPALGANGIYMATTTDPGCPGGSLLAIK